MGQPSREPGPAERPGSFSFATELSAFVRNSTVLLNEHGDFMTKTTGAQSRLSAHHQPHLLHPDTLAPMERSETTLTELAIHHWRRTSRETAWEHWQRFMIQKHRRMASSSMTELDHSAVSDPDNTERAPRPTTAGAAAANELTLSVQHTERWLRILAVSAAGSTTQTAQQKRDAMRRRLRDAHRDLGRAATHAASAAVVRYKRDRRALHWTWSSWTQDAIRRRSLRGAAEHLKETVDMRLDIHTYI